MSITYLVAGSTGLLGSSLVEKLFNDSPVYFNETKFIVRFNHNFRSTPLLSNANTIPVHDLIDSDEWTSILSTYYPSTIVLISNIRHLKPILKTLALPRFANYLPRLIVVGTTGVFSSFKNYSQEYLLLENLLFSYSGSYLLLRPSMIYGSRKDKNLHKVFDFIRKYNFYPIFGSGNNLLHPVHYKDLVNVLHLSMLKSTLAGAYNLPGLYPLTYSSLVRVCFHALEKKPRIVHIPLKLVVLFLNILPRYFKRLIPFTEEQLIRLTENKIFPYHQSLRDLNYFPRSFRDGSLEFLSE